MTDTAIGSDRWPGTPPRATRKAAGLAARERLPIAANAELEPTDRDPIAVLEEQAKARVPELLALRHSRMAASPFAFYRGAAALMADDLRLSPDSGIVTQLCGDAHLSNVGLFASPERALVMDLNDFDETAPGPFEWDVKRMAASFELVGRLRGFDEGQRARIIARLIRGYAAAVREAARTPVLELATARLDFDELFAQVSGELRPEAAARMAQAVTKTRRRDSADAVGRLAERVGDSFRFRSMPPLLTPIKEVAEQGGVDEAGARARVEAMLTGYRDSLTVSHRHLLDRFRIVDVARKVVGVGSVGTRAWVVLFVGNGSKDVLVLQAKEAGRSVLEPPGEPSAFGHQGERVVIGQRRMQALGDVLLGWTRAAGLDGRPRDFYVRQFRDWKGSAAPELMERSTMRLYAEYCGIVLGRAHARSGDGAVISGYVGDGDEFSDALTAFASAYADRTEVDHAALLDAIASGRLPSTGT